MEAHTRFRPLRPARAPRLLPALFAVLLCSALALHAGAQSPAPTTPYTFRIYEDLVQLPTMVLTSLGSSYPNLKADAFAITLDGGPRFHPRHVRLEGEDPISLALVLDLSSWDSAEIAHKLDSVPADLPPNWLAPRNHISLYALDCSVTRSLFDAPYSTTLLQVALRSILSSPLLKQKPSHSPFCDSARLWDSIAGVVKEISDLPGRRVLVVLTDGVDHHSSNTWHNLQLYAGEFGVTLIGLRPSNPALQTLINEHMGISVLRHNEEIFNILCGSSGGIVLPVDTDTLRSQLQNAVTLLRQRYILEFARPSNGTVGLHAVDVRVPDVSASVRTAGITFPIKDQALETDPTTLRSDPSRAPVLGNRKILTQPQ